jgi:hypothetical protein
MSASDNLSKPLFHGTTENMKPGDIIKPTPQVISGLTEAYATHNYDEAYNYAGARSLGRHTLFGSVYEVEPLEKDTTLQKKPSLLTNRKDVRTSEVGFRVKRHVNWAKSHA